MYLVAQISPLEWRKASVCNHDEHLDCDDEINEFHHHHSSNSLNNFEVEEKEDLMTNRETSITTKDMEDKIEMEGDADGNCCENYSNTSTLQHHQQYFKNMCVMSEGSDLENTWINMESRRNFYIAKQHKQHALCSHSTKFKQLQQIGSSKVSDENLDIDDDGLIGYATADADVALKRVQDNGDEDDDENLDLSSIGCDEHTREFTAFDDDESHESIELISYVNNFCLKNAFAWTLGTLLQTSDLYPKVL
jgi:hypothetical protein